MYVLLFDISKHLLLRKTDILKTCQKSKFLLAKEKTWKHIFNSNSELSQNCTEKQLCYSTVNYLFIDM